MKRYLGKAYTFFLLIFIYRILLDYIYLRCTTEWAYTGFLSNGDSTTALLSWVILTVLSLAVLPYFKSKESFYPDLIILIFLMRIVPLTCLIKYIKQPDAFVLWECVFWLLLILLPRIVKIRPVPLVKTASNSNFFINASFVIFSAVVLFVSGYYAHFRFHLSLLDVYELREESMTFEVPTVLGYLWAASTNILPLLFAYYFFKKKTLFCCLIAFVILLNFSINGMKSTLFKLVLCFVFSIVNTDGIRKWYTPGFIILILSSIVEYTFLKISLIHDIVIRRVLLVPSLLDTFYFDYISKHGLWFYKRTGTKIQYLIGDNYYNDVTMSCNNGLFSDAYMNMGVIGCFVYPLVLALFFRICSSAFRGVNKGLVIFAAIIMSYTLEGSEFTTALLTHGLFLLAVILYLMSGNNIKANLRISRYS